MKLKLSGRLFVKDSSFKFHENPRKGLDADAMSQKDGRTNECGPYVSIRFAA